ncbi:MAG: glycosyl hydrolase-related protein, partial [Verrucomicrobia bacterium]|nr:glycosyl hydrolase-related protein [Verrucomicrobiota bacterium]
SPYHLRRCDIARFDSQAWDLYWDAFVLSHLEAELAADAGVSDRAWQGLLLAELNRFCNTLDLEERATWEPSRAILSALYAHPVAGRTLELSVIGHAHIDTAWLWPLAETDRKCERTFSSATAYMRDYPEYRFACSQAYQYNVIKQRNPDLYARIQQAVTAGQFVPVGGTWIEPDCNIPSGEALCRQFLFGQRFFEAEFGRRCREFWNPDVFGYNGQLPQIMRQSGIARFLTQKLSWNRFNKPKHHTFTWRGIDGSEVLTHFPPSDTYNALGDCWGGKSELSWLRHNLREFRDHDRSNEAIMLYGFGDGGGGPTKAMLEIIRRANNLEGLPRTVQRTSDDFFDRLEKNIVDRPLLIGELYFEYHRGTYTSQALVKRNNRRAEQLLHDLEFLATAGAAPYPRAEINALWRTLLLNQFHDILPGSSIKQVYADSAEQFSAFFQAGEKLLPAGKTPINTIAFTRAEVVTQGDKLAFIEAPAYGPGQVTATTDAVSISTPDNTLVLESAHLRATFTTGGRLLSLLHKPTQRESLAGEANLFELYDDHPTQFDAWDVDPYHLETRQPCSPATSHSIVRRDALRAEIRFTYTIGKASSITQTVRLDAGAQRLEFHCEADWHESHRMLKVAFPIRALAQNATYEMQFGHVERPTHYNTPYDLARYEVPMHRWFDFGEHGFGVAILNDCKYGGSTFDNTMRLSLLRAPKAPDPDCDMGQHHFAFAVMPHAGNWRDAGVVAEAYRFNNPLRFLAAPGLTATFASVDNPNLILETIKRAEDSDAVILRFYEAHGARGEATVTLSRDFKTATRCNILEDDGDPLPLAGRTLRVTYSPHELISVKLA